MRIHYGVFSCVLALATLAAGCGSSNSSMTAPTPTTGGSSMTVSIVRGAVSLTSTAYAPNPITIAVGQTVMWTNNDVTAHTSSSDTGAWESGTIAAGASFSRMFPTAGTFTYHCTIHPGMVGTVIAQ